MDWTLVVIAAAKGGPIEPVQLQKCLFLISRNLDLPSSERYEFDAYDYGPFSKTIYSDATWLEGVGLVTIRSVGTSRDYSATLNGLAEAERLRATLKGPHRQYLDDVVAWARSLSFKQLVRAIYEQYPDMKANSVFQY